MLTISRNSDKLQSNKRKGRQRAAKVKIMKTLSFVCATEEEIEVGKEYLFGQLWDGNGDGEELLSSGSIYLGDDENDMPVIADFEIAENNDDILKATIRILDIR